MAVEIQGIKSRVKAMLGERELLAGENDIYKPSKYWTDFCSYFEYVMDLPDKYFERIRLHTYHLTSDNYLTYYFGDPQALEIPMRSLSDGLPDQFAVSEPEGGIGFRLPDGRFASWDTYRFQQVIRAFYKNGIFDKFLKLRDRRHVILEIGGGYGGLAHQLSRLCPNTTYIILDLPETLLFSASYLGTLNPRKSVYLYDKETVASSLAPSGVNEWDFILLPNYKLEALRGMRFELVINILSLQEMQERQVALYLDFIRDTCDGFFYSNNQDRQERNLELKSLTEMLSQRFQLKDISHDHEWSPRTGQESALTLQKVIYKVIGRVGRGLMNFTRDKKPEKEIPHRMFLCKPLVH